MSSSESDEEEMNEDDNISLEDQHQAENENFSYSPETLLSLAGNLEFVVGKVTALSKRLRSAAFIDAESMLNEITFSCNNISEAVEKIGKTAEKYLEESATKSYLPENLNTECELHDPGKRPTTLSDSDRTYLIHLGPCQPKLTIFPKNAEIKKSSQCRFSASWYNEYRYLEHSISNDSAHCFVCSLFPITPGRQKGR